MSRTTRRPPTSGTKTRQPARRAVATLAVAFLFGLAASEARAGIAFVQNIGTQKATSTGVTIAITVPAGGVAAGHSIILTFAGADVTGTFSATDSAGNSYSVDVNSANTGKIRTVIFSAHNVSALAAGSCNRAQATA